ncbi:MULTISPECIES: NAD(P)-binding domain-containing protein [Vagococcus]|uniref:L-lactate dehydrogenase n=1 Tax=Vagococcus fluvialis bH819 TaxID=1255619 RepID=A0A1X6WRH7_9ENTE|nr:MULTISPECIES: NAD(P)-binding domain-containing protein [Vagococcus]SLM86951.1 L-lactate dehydrogenase [Vagococcus fluvialis bH819]HCM88954.1 L-lactate dehydrogenase [Vagococcus sp.]
MGKIGIIGMGHVGSDVAYTLCREKLTNHLVLIDPLKEKVLAEKLELEDSMIGWDYSIKIETQNYASLQDAEIVVISVGSQNIDNENRNSELIDNVKAVRESIPQIVASGFKGIFVVISNPCDVITKLVQEVSGFPYGRVIGTGTLLDSHRLKRVVGQYLEVSPQDVSGYVLGEHGENQFVPWSLVSVREKSMLQEIQLSSDVLYQLKEETRLGGWHIHAGKGWTSYGIASACSRLIQAIQQDENRVYPTSSYDEVEDLYIGWPTIIGRQGVIGRLPLNLLVEEKEAYQASAKEIISVYDRV